VSQLQRIEEQRHWPRISLRDSGMTSKIKASGATNNRDPGFRRNDERRNGFPSLVQGMIVACGSTRRFWIRLYRQPASPPENDQASPRGNEDDGCQVVEAAVTGRALSTRSCTGQTHVGAASPRSTNQLHDGAMAGKHPSFARMDLQNHPRDSSFPMGRMPTGNHRHSGGACAACRRNPHDGITAFSDA
jgi:hypothetical protein